MIDRCIVGAVLAGKAHLPHLRLSRLYMPFVRVAAFLRCRLRGNAVRTAIEAGAVVHDRRVVDVRVAHVGVVNHRRVHVHHRGVVSEHAAAPLAAAESDSAISEAVIHAAIEAHMRTPVSRVPCINSAVSPAPVSRRPQQARLRSLNPRTWNPEVSSITVIRPVSRRPDVVRFRTNRLNIYRQRRRCDGNRDPN